MAKLGYSQPGTLQTVRLLLKLETLRNYIRWHPATEHELSSPIPHSKFVGSEPNDLANVFAKEPCCCWPHHCASWLSQFAPLYAVMLACQAGSDPQSVLEKRAIVGKKMLDETSRNCREAMCYMLQL
jgi:hypothetical protein